MTLSAFWRLGYVSLIGFLAVTTLSACGFVLGDAKPDAEPTQTPTSAPEAVSTPLPTPAPTSTPAPTRIAVPFPALPAPAAPAPAANVFGVPIGGDAAPASEQFLTLNYSREGSAMDFAVSALDRAGGGFESSMSLVMLGKDMEAVPGAALGWETSPDMTTWTFHIDSGLRWSDETPVSAGDFVFTWQYYADPDHAYDYADYFARLGVANWERVNTGALPLSDLGVEATDDQTLVFHLDRPTAYVPRFLVYGAPLARHQALLHGTLYGNDPETAVSFTPWILTDWKPNQYSVFEPNLEYTGHFQPKIEKINFVFSENGFDQYRAGAIDSISGPFGSAAQARILSDADLVDERGASPGGFRTHYLTFNFRQELFSDPRIRRSIARAIDRDRLINDVIGEGAGVPSYGILMAGFPDAVTEDLRAFQRFDPTTARALLADAGYPNGEGFPRIELESRHQTVLAQTVVSAVAEQLALNLGIEIDVVDGGELGAPVAQAPRITLDAISADYIDASSFLRVFKTNGRHNWNNDEFEALRIAAIENPDPEERQAQTLELQKMLSDQAAGVFLWSELRSQLHKPYLKGPWRDESAAGWSGLQPPGWSPGFGTHNIYTVYIGDDVSAYERSPF